MGVPREDLLLMMRALKRGFADLKGIRKALDRQVSKPISLLEALHLSTAEADALRADSAIPDAVQDRPLLDSLQKLLIDAEQMTSAEWEKFAASFARPTQRHFGPLSVPQEFDGYTLQWELARRERGVVYRAKDKDGRDTAIKVFRKDVAVAGDLPRVDGHAYAVSEFVDGESLEAKRPSARRGAHAVWKAAEQLRDRTHGALSPARIVIKRDDSIAVLGLESAKAVPPSARAKAYAGPSDVHALGAILYEVIVGTPPAGETSPKARVRDSDENLDRIVSCALSGGYASTGAMADDLGHYFNGEPITGRKAPAAGTAAGRKSRVWILVAAALPIASLIVYLLLPKPKPAAPETPDPVVKEEKAAPKPAPPETKPKETVKAPPKPVVPAKPMDADEEQKLYDQCVEALAKGDNEKVLSTANEAISRGAKRDWPYYQLANLFLSRNELDKALEYVSRALELSPDNRDSLEMRAQTYVFRGEAKKALADLDTLYGKKVTDLTKQIIELGKQAERDPKDARPRFLRGVFYIIKRHYETAATDFTAAVDGGFPRALAWRALAFKGADDPARAAADARAYLKAYPNDFASAEVKALLKEIGAN
jgi:cytochrome c-type biogenesis protein CcmH/NrfG